MGARADEKERYCTLPEIVDRTSESECFSAPSLFRLALVVTGAKAIAWPLILPSRIAAKVRNTRSLFPDINVLNYRIVW